MTYLLATLAALAGGPLLAAGARRLRATTIALDAFVLVVLGGLVILHILPHALESAGVWALVVAAGTFVLASMAERGLHRHHGEGHAGVAPRLMVGLAMTGLFVHQMVDGIALAGSEHGDATPDGSHAHIWAIAVLLHSLPKSIALWWIVAPLLGVRAASTMLGLMAAGTLLGFGLGESLLAFATPTSVALFEALLCGTLLHVVMHADLPPPAAGTRTWEVRTASLIGLVLGVLVIVAVEGGHSHSHDGEQGGDFLSTFLMLATASAPALVAAYLAIGLAQAVLPTNLALLGRKGPVWLQALRGVAIGLPLPVCSCGVVPMYRDLMRRGVSVAAGIAFLVATPELEIAALLLTWQLLGGEFAMTRIGAAAVLAIAAAIVTARRAPPVTADGAATDDPPRPRGLLPRLNAGMRAGLGESVDETAPWILVGLGLAALLTPLLDPAFFVGMPSAVAVPLAALIGMPLYVCASGSTPLAAVLVMKGLSPGAALAFLLTGPATNVTTFGVLSRLHDRRTAVVFATVMFLGSTALGLLVDLFLPRDAGVVHTLDAHDGASTFQSMALLALGAIVLVSVLRQGVRRFLGQLFDTPTLAELTAPEPAAAEPESCCGGSTPAASPKDMGHRAHAGHEHGHHD